MSQWSYKCDVSMRCNITTDHTRQLSLIDFVLRMLMMGRLHRNKNVLILSVGQTELFVGKKVSVLQN